MLVFPIKRRGVVATQTRSKNVESINLKLSILKECFYLVNFSKLFSLDFDAAIFSVKTFASAIIAYYVSLYVGFSQPVWSVVTVYLVAQPFSGAVISKAFLRLLGTVIGGAAAVIFLPEFVDQPMVLSTVLALWLGLCMYAAQLDGTPRSYVFLLAGYTASIIGFPSINNPAGIFDVAVLRVEEIGIGIVAATLIHGLILPRTATKRLRQLVSSVTHSAENLSRQSLAGGSREVLETQRHRIVGFVNEIEQLTYHVAFDVDRLVPLGRTIRGFQDQLSWVLPLGIAVEDRLRECQAIKAEMPETVTMLVKRIDEWLGSGVGALIPDLIASELIQDAEGLLEDLTELRPWDWQAMLLASLLKRLRDLVEVHRSMRELSVSIETGRIISLSSETNRVIMAATGRTFHRDHGLALRTSIGTVGAVLGVCIFWIESAWPSGAVAALIVGVGCALIGTLPSPGVMIKRFLSGSILGVFIAMVYGFMFLPRVTDFPILMACMAPPLLLFGSLLTRPPLTARALGGILGFLTTVGLSNAYQGNFIVFSNAAIAQLAATAVASVVIGISHVVGAEEAFLRLYRAGFRDIAARAEGRRPDSRGWILTMMDRIALITARLGPFGVHPSLPPYDAVTGLTIGYLAGELSSVARSIDSDAARSSIKMLLAEISAHYRKADPKPRVPLAQSTLESIDAAMTYLSASPESQAYREAIIVLIGLRRVLFPSTQFTNGERT